MITAIASTSERRLAALWTSLGQPDTIGIAAFSPGAGTVSLAGHTQVFVSGAVGIAATGLQMIGGKLNGVLSLVPVHYSRQAASGTTPAPVPGPVANPPVQYGPFTESGGRDSSADFANIYGNNVTAIIVTHSGLTEALLLKAGGAQGSLSGLFVAGGIAAITQLPQDALIRLGSLPSSWDATVTFLVPSGSLISRTPTAGPPLTFTDVWEFGTPVPLNPFNAGRSWLAVAPSSKSGLWVRRLSWADATMRIRHEAGPGDANVLAMLRTDSGGEHPVQNSEFTIHDYNATDWVLADLPAVIPPEDVSAAVLGWSGQKFTLFSAAASAAPGSGGSSSGGSTSGDAGGSVSAPPADGTYVLIADGGVQQWVRTAEFACPLT